MTDQPDHARVQEARKALHCLRIAIDESVAADVNQKVEAALAYLLERIEALERERDGWREKWINDKGIRDEMIAPLEADAASSANGLVQFVREKEAAEAARDAALAVVQNFANPENWSDKVGCLQWIGKRHGLEYANSMLAALAPAGEQG
jgi:hypothetical protein